MTRRGRLAIGWTVALLGIALFVRLGVWQSSRAVEKQALLDSAAQVLRARDAGPLSLAADPARARALDWAQGTGHFDARDALLLDNQQRERRVGVRTYRVFVPDDGQPLLVDLGWRALPGDRTLPSTPPLTGTHTLRGLLAPPPSSGLAMGPAMQRQRDAWLLSRVDLADIAAQTGLSVPLAPRVLRLDPDLPIGYTRDLALLANTLPPDKHRGYALQWFALALAVFVTALVVSRPRTPA